ncbi:MAG: ArnT family glycosyltransferase [Anaerolineae bacterium]
MRFVGRTHALALMLLCLLAAAALRLPDLPATPPGLHYDEAANGVLAAEIGLQGERPIFISSYTGKEVLFFYLAGGLMRLIGGSVFVLRLTAAFVGLLTIAATYWLGWELLADRRIALIAAALLAVSFWHLLFSRLGFRAITQPLLQAFTVAALFRGLRRQQWGWFIVGGVFLGAAAYTYLAVRLFPILLLVAALPLLFSQRPYRRQLALFGIVALIVLAPLLSYFASHPEAFWVRITQVAPVNDTDALGLPASYLKSLGMFFVAGDPYWRFNLPERPLFDWFWGGLLMGGWLVCALRWRRLPSARQRAAALLLILTPFFMILPTALAAGEIVPSNLRAVGLLPFIFYLPAIGLVTLLDGLEERFHRPPLPQAVLAAGLLILLVGSMEAGRAYFRAWALQPALYYASDGDLAAVAQFLAEADIAGKTIYVSALHYRHPTLAFLSRHYDEIKWLPDSQAFVFPAEGPAMYIYPHNSPVPDWAAPFLETAVSLDSPAAPDGQPAFLAYELAAPPPLTIPNPVSVNFGNHITLLGYEVDGAAAGATMPLTLYWRVDGEPAAGFAPFVHLEDAWGYRWSQVETFAYPAEQWQPGEIIVQHVELPVPPGAPPGAYRLRLGLFDPDSGDRLPQLGEDGRYAGDTFIIEAAPVHAAAPPKVLPHPPHVLDEQLLPALRLLGYERGSDKASAGDTFGLALWWQATASLPRLTTRLELYQPDDTDYLLLDTQPVHGTYPFPDWDTPLFLIDRMLPRIPDNVPPGDYNLRLQLLDDNDGTLLTADLGPLTVEATERLFTPPASENPLAATFGGEIKLVGYELEAGEAKGQFTLSLIWQALARPSADYTVFVHVLGLDGVCCHWQQDAMPRQNQYPTSRWLAGEVVVDAYQIVLEETLPPGKYPIEVGLYIADTGRRLQVTMPGLPANDALFLRPLLVE